MKITNKVAEKMTVKGFTLIEVLVVVALLSVLALIAIPSYESYIFKSRRADALGVLQSMQLAQEKYRASNNLYGTIAQAWGGVTSTDGGHYTLNVTNQTATSYTLTANAQNRQTNDQQGGVSCAVLTMTVNGASVTKAPTQCW